MNSSVMQGLVEKYGVELPSPQAAKCGTELIIKDGYGAYSRMLILSVCDGLVEAVELDSDYKDCLSGEILRLPAYILQKEIYYIPKTYVFEDLISSIRTPVRAIVRDFLENKVPADFWFRASSSTGKYHPDCENGTEGLVRHTVRVAEIVRNLSNEVLPEESDLFVAAALIHDTFKYPTPGLKYTEFMHPKLAADAFIEFYEKECPESYISVGEEIDPCIRFIADIVSTHHGYFNTCRHSDGVLSAPHSNEGWLLHHADFMASMKLSYE